jgi:hypothetical protein
MFVIAGFSALTLFSLNHAAKAELAAVGPQDPITGYPAFLQDTANQQIQLCSVVNPVLDAGVIANSAPCAALELEDPGVPGGDPGPGATFENIGEGFFYLAKAEIRTALGERFLVRIEAEVTGGQVLHDVRIRLRKLVQPGTYIVETPLGSLTTTLAAVGGNDFDGTLPGGAVGIQPDYAGALNGNISCFWSNGTGNAVVVPGQSFLGDSVTDAPLIPNPACPQTAADMIFKITLPDGSVQQTNLFSVQGQLFQGTGVLPRRTTYERNADGAVARLDSFVRSLPGQIINVSGAGLPNRRMLENPQRPGDYVLRQRFQGTAPILPPAITIEGLTVALIDEVDVRLARYNVNNDTLTVRAASSDLNQPPVLTAFDQDGLSLGTLTAGELTVTLPIQPASVTIRSSKGGEASQVVDILGGNVIGQ